MKTKILFLTILILWGVSGLQGDSLWGKDKVAHFSASMFLVCWNSRFCEEALEVKSKENLYLGVGITFGLGLGKESRDLWVKKTEWSWGDLFWDAMGIGCGLIMINNLK